MGRMMTIGHLTTADKDARDKVIKAFEDIVQYSKDNEPGVSIYAITIPTNPSDQRTIYMIEEYFPWGVHKYFDV